MSTTSLSSYDQGEYCQCTFYDDYGRNYQAGGAAQFYNALGQPLVYYAQLEHQFNRPKRENRNCFVKAFKWYTQKKTFVNPNMDHLTLCETDLRVNDHRVPPDLKDFAKWLDSKYSEYLSETEAQRSAPNSVREPTIANTPCPPCNRRFPRMRSPWSKRKSSNKNAGEVIGKPKSYPPSCPNKCYASNEALEPKKGVVKSRSMTSICHESLTRNCIEVITVQEGPNKVPIACPKQNTKVDKKLESETKEKKGKKECNVEKYECSPWLVVPCNEPPLCQNKCKTKQNLKLVQQPSRLQRTETRSNETFSDRSVSQTYYETNTSVRDKAQRREQRLETNLQSDQPKERTLVQETKSYARESFCDPNCRNQVKTIEQCKNVREKREVPVKSCVLETCEETSKLARELYLARNAREGQRALREQKYANELEHDFELETEQSSVTKQQLNTPCDRCTVTKDMYPMQVPEYQQRRPVQINKRASPLPKKSKVDVECQCPEYPRIQPERLSFERTQNNSTMMLQRNQEKPKNISPVYKKQTKPKVNVSCQCSAEEVNTQTEASTEDRPPDTPCLVFYTNDVQCQCSDDKIKQKSVPQQRSQIKTKIIKAKEKIAEGSYQCSDRDTIQYDSFCQYRRNDCEPTVNGLCLCPKPVRRITPVCHIQKSESCSCCPAKNCVNVKRTFDSVAEFRSDGLQTSDHSINIEEHSQNYALFMKIVCADKLK